MGLKNKTILFSSIILILSIGYGLADFNSIGYGAPISFATILSPDIGSGLTLNWGQSISVTLTNPNDPKKSPIILGTNVPLNTSVTDNSEFIRFYGNLTYAPMLAHFNCKKEDESCINLNLNVPVVDMCLLIASVDGFDHVTLNSSKKGKLDDMNTWEVCATGQFSDSLPKAGRIVTRKSKEEISLGCFDETSKNVNYVILKPTTPIDNLQICYKSYSERSEYVLYSIVECGDAEDDTFALSGFAFSDKLYSSNRIDNPPLPFVTVSLVKDGQIAVNLDGDQVAPKVTDQSGYYFFDYIPKGLYFIVAQSPSGVNFSYVVDTNQGHAYTNKVYFNGQSVQLNLVQGFPGIRTVDHSLPSDIPLSSKWVLPEINIGVIPINTSLNGNIFKDYNGNGIKDEDEVYSAAIDVAFEGVVVKLYDGDRLLAVATTDDYGNFFFRDIPLIESGYKVVVETPDGYQMTNYPFPPAPPPSEPLTLIILVSEPLLIGLINKPDYCQANPLMALICYAQRNINETNGNDPVLIALPINATDHLYNMPEGTVTHLAHHKDIGAVYGLGFHRKTKNIFTSAFLKYFSGFGPSGTGAIYKTPFVEGAISTLFFDLNQATSTSDYAGSDPHEMPMDNFDEGFGSIGKIAFGDLDIHDDDLYTIALKTKELLKVNINDPTIYTLTPIFNPCTTNPQDWRPFGLGKLGDNILIGGVCSMESTGDETQIPTGYIVNDQSEIVLTIPLNFPRGCKIFGNGFCVAGDYTSWTDNFFASQPWISDITMDGADMIISIRDRGGDQDLDVGAYDMLRACWDGSQFVLENTGVCGGITGAHPNPSGYFGRPDGINGGEYYNDNFFFPRDNDGHDNLGSTAGVVIPGFYSLFGSSLDIDYIGQGAVKVWDNRDGSLVKGIAVYVQNATLNNNFGKANGLGDMEPLCFDFSS
ncbi:hypothetical protein CYY_004698 [Polysphondylium violaceum]|uniref:SD-repeat containing protein B domain-containing protein n=1 Tax=Polysphondylium violaceum TaxID=133409 RepID=A0A8J4Q4V6_9MYCE|nr:hypothetical protein CYY_004698 [Polysphondylium violaceum]